MRSIFESILLFTLLIYSTIFVDNAPNYISKEIINHPLTRFFVLFIIFYYISTEEYVALVILFAYILTILSFLSQKKLKFENKPVIVEEDKKTEKQNLFSVPFIKSNDFTTEFQFKDAQSNVVNEEAMNTEICIWEKGYSTQGIKNMVKDV